MDELQLGDDVIVRGLTVEQRRAAALAVCDRATDVDDAAELLGALGLLEDRQVLRTRR